MPNRDQEIAIGATKAAHELRAMYELGFRDGVQHARDAGHWKRVSKYVCTCSKCNSWWVVGEESEKYKFCPNCGADMRGEKADEPLQHD